MCVHRACRARTGTYAARVGTYGRIRTSDVPVLPESPDLTRACGAANSDPDAIQSRLHQTVYVSTYIWYIYILIYAAITSITRAVRNSSTKRAQFEIQSLINMIKRELIRHGSATLSHLDTTQGVHRHSHAQLTSPISEVSSSVWPGCVCWQFPLLV